MMKHPKMRRVLLLALGIISLMGTGVLADKENLSITSGSTISNSTSPTEALRCKTSLKRVSLQLEACAKQREQPYYADLYQQIQDFLGTLESPISSSQLDKCENFLHVIQGITGIHAEPGDLGPMREYAGPQTGKVTNPALETTASRRPLSSIRYETYDQMGEEEFGGLRASSPPSPGTKKSHASEEIEKLD